MTMTVTSWYIESNDDMKNTNDDDEDDDKLIYWIEARAHWLSLESIAILPAGQKCTSQCTQCTVLACALCCTKLQCNAMPAIHFQMLSVHQSTVLCPKNHFLIFWIASYCTLIHFTAQNRILLQLLHWIEKHWSELHRTKLHFYNNNKLHWTELHFIVVCTIQQQLHYAVLGFLTRPLKFTHLWYKVTSSGVGELFFFCGRKKDTFAPALYLLRCCHLSHTIS